MIDYEVFIKEFLPDVRNRAARIIINKYKMSQVETAHKLGVTQAEVSKYVNNIRKINPKSKIDEADMENFVYNLVNNDDKEAQYYLCKMCPINTVRVCSFKDIEMKK